MKRKPDETLHNDHNNILANEEILKLFSLYRQGNTSAKEQIILSNLHLVDRIAKKYCYDFNNLDDLVQEGTIGLMKAIDKFDEKKNDNFAIYAIYWIQKYIYQYIEKNKIIAVPNSINKLIKEIEEFELSNLEYNEQIICEKFSISEKQLAQIKRYKYQQVELQNDDFIANKDDDLLVKIVLTDLISNIENKKDALILKMYLGLDGYSELSFEKIGEILNISKVAVYKRYNKIVKQLRDEYGE